MDENVNHVALDFQSFLILWNAAWMDRTLAATTFSHTVQQLERILIFSVLLNNETTVLFLLGSGTNCIISFRFIIE